MCPPRHTREHAAHLRRTTGVTGKRTPGSRFSFFRNDGGSMANRPIAADCAPCPLTVGEWMAFLAAESQVKSGYTHLVVTVLLMFYRWFW